MENPVKYLSFSGGKSMPVILQTEVAECGLACIAMIASYYGHKINLSALRRDYPTSLKGTNVKSLLGLIETLSFSARAVKVELNQLENLQLPFLAHWDLNHFVVVTNISSNKVTIHDPAYGKRVLSMAEASKHFTGVAIELLPTKEFEKKDDEISMGLSDLWGRTSGLKKAFIQIFTLSLLLQVFSLINPFFMQIVVDNVIVGNDVDLLTLLGTGFSMLVLIVVCTELLRSYIIMFLGTQLNIQIATNLFRHLLHLPAEFFEKRHIGDVLSRFQSIDEIKDLLTKGLIETVVDGLLVIGTLILMLVYSQLLGTVVLSVVLIYGTIRYIMFTTLRRYTEESIYAEANEKTNFLESVRAFQCIKLFGRETQRQDVWSNQYAKSINADIKVNKYKFTFKAIENLFFGLENVAVIYLAATLVIDNELSVGMMFAFMAYKLQFSTKSSAVIDKIVEYKMLGLHLSRIADIAMTPQEVTGLRTENNPKPQGKLTIENISFQFSPDEPLFLDNASFSFKPGEATAIIGPSGSGKTTLMKIMLGLVSPTKGRVLIDDVSIHRYGLKNYRSGVAAVMQNDQLLSGTLLDNITFFDTHPDIEHAKECAKLAHIHDDIIDMPMGYDSLIGDMGAALSGGQQQRILLARALYSRPSILFLDEATSHLDPKLESIVSLAVKRLNMTRIIIAHRAETYRSADKIIRLFNGKLREVKLRQK